MSWLILHIVSPKNMNTQLAFDTLWQKNGDREGALAYLIENKHIEHISVKGLDCKIIRVIDPDKYIDQDFYTQLTQRGVAVLKIVDSSEELDKYRTEFLETIGNFPEYKQGANAHVLGGFAAFGNPASFHNKLVRDLRMRAYSRLSPNISEINKKRNGHTYNLEALPDRMMLRKKGVSATAESWHRDVMPANKIELDDELLGGWINLDTSPQYFSTVPGSHLNIRQSEIRSGFDTLVSSIDRELKQTKEFSQLSKLEQTKQIALKVKEFTNQNFAHKIEIPPMHMVVFPQYIMHEVVATKAKIDMFRLFTTWRLTVSEKPLHSINKFGENIIADQAVPCLGGGMQPPMYSSNHLSYFVAKPFIIIPNIYKENMVTWSSETFKDECLSEQKSYTETQKKNVMNGSKTYRIVEKHMRSLKHYNFPLYPEYSSDEMTIYKPTAIS
jgi:hypothetical protein